MSTVGVRGSLEVTLKAELFVPVDVGLKATLMVKVLPVLIVLLPPFIVILNIDASVSVILEFMLRLPVPLFLTLKEAVLLLFTLTLPKL